MARSIRYLLPALLLCSVVSAEPPAATSAEIEHFEKEIRPLLVRHCYECHSGEAKTVHGGLRLDTAEALASGGDTGPAIDLNTPEASLLLDVLHYEGDIQMPPEGKLPPDVIAKFEDWVKRGAAMPASGDIPERTGEQIDFEKGRQFWSFQPALRQPLPEVKNSEWPESRIDGFVLAAMEQEGFSPSPPADRATLIRRLSFDITGLPPTREEVQSFATDPSPQAYSQLVDRLLESPHYGEKWGRMWLDLVRYTDRTASWLDSTGQAYLYRDWVIRAFNEDMPFDEFVHRQLATDLMAETGPDDLPALGLLSLSPTYWKELKLPCEIIKTIVADEWEERVDAVSRTFLGLTVACARCHDHKFDPISSTDYYALAGVFASCRLAERPMVPEEEYAPIRAAKEKVAKLEEEIAKLKKQKPPPKEEIDKLNAEVAAIKSSTPGYEDPLANALAEESMYVVRAGETAQDGTRLDYRPEPRDLPLFIRGNPNRPGPIVPRRFLTVLSSAADESGLPTRFTQGSGRLELAKAMTGDAAPLVARVIVNRIWLAHFGKGLVGTPSNFGQQGDRPTHPELLDDLVVRFIANGWSIKQLHREILNSATWKQSSSYDEEKVTRDPENKWLSRMNRRRLEFESWRDAMLAASGKFDLSMGGPSEDLDQSSNIRRTIYATIHRREMSTTLSIHDFPDPAQHSPARTPTTTALQGLFALNGPLLMSQAETLSAKLQQDHAADLDAGLADAYWRLYSRAPTENEMQLGKAFFGDTPTEQRQEKWTQYLHVLLASNELLFVD
ncbi:MAG: PSD1 domain-containing protein [Planctomycetaceae bacterium]|nr:PSD1 domain-containing protein [Planctomycetaceae bacterium]